MYIPPNTCAMCWSGQYVNGICSNCHHRMTPPQARQPDALPMKYVLKQRYVIGEVLGQGGFGITYSAWDNQQNRRVAVKELYPKNDVCRDNGYSVRVTSGNEQVFRELVKKFEDEAQLLLQLDSQCGECAYAPAL